MSRSYFVRHWRGELSLPTSFWFNSCALVAIVILSFQGLSSADISSYPRYISSLFVASWFLSAISLVWLVVGIVRSAREYSISFPNKKNWSRAAIVFASLGLLLMAYVMIVHGIPQIKAAGEIISSANQKKAYSIRLLRNETELELQGPLDFGVSAELAAILDAHPTVKILQLDSSGGRLVEGNKLVEIVLNHNLDTHVRGECQSTCVTVFVAGKNRLISKAAVLGLHRPDFPGLSESAIDANINAMKDFFRSRGVDGQFVEQGLSVDNTEIWRPPHSLLLSSHLATGYSADDIDSPN